MIVFPSIHDYANTRHTGRPSQTIDVKVPGLAWRNRLCIACEIRNDDGSLKSVRQLGGRLEFGESWRDVPVREFDKEREVPIQVGGTPVLLENTSDNLIY